MSLWGYPEPDVSYDAACGVCGSTSGFNDFEVNHAIGSLIDYIETLEAKVTALSKARGEGESE